MKLFLLSSFGVLVAMSAAAPTISAGLDPHFEKFSKAAKQYMSMLDGLANTAGVAEYWNIADYGSDAPVKKERETGLREVSVQGACGVQSGARGLTPEAEWRRMFPNPPGYSR